MVACDTTVELVFPEVAVLGIAVADPTIGKGCSCQTPRHKL